MNAARRRKGFSNLTGNKGSIVAVGWEERWRGVAPKKTHWKEEEATKERNILNKTGICKRRSKPLGWTLRCGAGFQPLVCVSMTASEGPGKITEEDKPNSSSQAFAMTWYSFVCISAGNAGDPHADKKNPCAKQYDVGSLITMKFWKRWNSRSTPVQKKR